MVRIVEWSAQKPQSKVVTKFLERSAFPEEAEKAAAEVLAAIRKDGDKAVAQYVAKFEGAKLTPKKFRVTDAELAAAEAQVPAALKKAVKDAYTRVMKFSKASLKQPWTMATPKGGTAGEFYSPMDRVGVYVPGGTAPLASTSVMTVTLAKAAGVKEIVACTPAGPTGTPNPVLLYAREPYLVCLAKLPDAIPDESRLEVAEYLHRANYGLLLGSFEMDYDRGEVRYRTALLTEGACPAESVLDRYIQMPAAMLDRYAAGIEAIVLEGEIAQEALARVEED